MRRVVGALLVSLASGVAAGPLEDLLARVEADRVTRAEARAHWRDAAEAAAASREGEAAVWRSQVATAEARAAELEARFEANATRLAELQERLRERGGDLAALSAAVRQVAAEAAAELAASPVSLERPARHDALGALAAAPGIVDIEDLEDLSHALLEEATLAGAVRRLDAEVVDAGGVRRRARVTRVGTFLVAAGGQLLEHGPGPLELRELNPQPPAAGAVSALEAPGTGMVVVPLDPTRGSLYAVLALAPSWSERLEQGGPIGAAILALALAGVLLALERLWVLGRVGRNVRRQLEARDEPRPDNPLGRVLGVLREDEGDVDLEVLEHRLDAAILRELPALRRGVRALKLMAGVAPLLGLLGTVTGMILTFQKLTLFGAGDPRLMADGISQALVTTALGLTVAIPLLFLHRLAASRAEAMAQVLEEESAGLLAARLEARHEEAAS